MTARASHRLFAVSAVNLHGLAFSKTRRPTSRRGGSARASRRFSNSTWRVLSRDVFHLHAGARVRVDCPRTSLLDCGHGFAAVPAFS